MGFELTLRLVCVCVFVSSPARQVFSTVGFLSEGPRSVLPPSRVPPPAPPASARRVTRFPEGGVPVAGLPCGRYRFFFVFGAGF